MFHRVMGTLWTKLKIQKDFKLILFQKSKLAYVSLGNLKPSCEFIRLVTANQEVLADLINNILSSVPRELWKNFLTFKG